MSSQVDGDSFASTCSTSFFVNAVKTSVLRARACAAALFVVCCCSCGVAGDDTGPVVVSSWSDFDGRLRSEVADGVPMKELATSDTVVATGAPDNRLLMSAMITQGEFPLVQLVGGQLLTAELPDASFRAAVAILGNTDAPESLILAPIYEQLEAGGDVEALGSVGTPIKDENAAIIVGALPPASLAIWCEQVTDQLPINVDVYAFALERLLEEEQGDLARWKQEMRNMRAIPGTPRLIYLMNVSERGERDSKLATEMLRDPALKAIHFAMLARRFLGEFDHEAVSAAVSERKQRILMEIVGDSDG